MIARPPPRSWTDTDDRIIARSIFGTDDFASVEAMILDWALLHGLRQGQLRSIELSVGAAVTIDMPDGPPVFVKIWPRGVDARGLEAQLTVLRGMAKRGYPAPSLLTELSALGPGVAVAMTYNRDGEPTDPRRSGVREHMARGLVHFIAEADRHRDTPALPRRELPSGAAVWPPPHNALFDFAATKEGAGWIDSAAADALAIMRRATSRWVVGHHDWSAKNMRMGPGGIAVLYDWDAVFLDREMFVLGSAAANFPMTWELPVPETPTPEEVRAFIQDYSQARGTVLSPSEFAEAAAAATYARAYKARCEHALDPAGANWHGSSRESLWDHGPYKFG